MLDSQKLDTGAEQRDARRDPRGLFEGLLRVGMFPVFVVTFNGQFQIEATCFISDSVEIYLEKGLRTLSR
jgi:hypothetical protein